MNNDTEVSIKFRNSITGETKLKQYAETLQKIHSILSSMEQGKIKQMEQSAKEVGNISNEADKMAKKVNIAFNYGAVRMFASSLSRVYSGIVRVTQKSSEFLESFNLFQVAFNGNYTSAERFMNKMTEMYGLDESWAIKTIGLFKQLANAMGLTADVGDKLSSLLTQMSVDISSLYNIDVDKVPAILQSALAGQTKPARRLGADITQTTLQQTLGDLGIDQSVVNLSYAEKRLLIVIALTQQLTQATGDWGRTLESPANQMRILNEQFSRLSREVGNVFLPILSKVLPYLNAIVMVLTEIISIIARLFGYKKEDYDYFGVMADDIEDFGAGVADATSGVEKLKRGLRGFDKLNNITTPSSSGAAAGGGVGGGINPELMNAFNKAYDDYFKKIGQVEMKATRIRDRIMQWLGFQKQIDEETGDVSFKFDHITGGTVLGALGVGGVIYGGIKTLLGIFTKITGIKFTGITKMVTSLGKIPKILSLISPQTAIIIAIVTTLVAVFVKLYKTNEQFREKVDKLVKMFKEDFLRVLNDIVDLLKPFLEDIWKILKQIWNEVIKPLAQILVDILEPIFTAIIDVLTVFWEKVFRPMYPILKWIVETALKAISFVLKVIVDDISAIIKVVKWLWDNILSYVFDFIVDSIKAKVIPAIQSIGNVINTIKKAIQKVVDWWNNLSFNKKDIKVNYSVGGGGTDSFSGGGGGGGRAAGGIFVNGKWQPVNYYANGQLGVPVGQMFVAREAGPELVGTIGSHTAVMNNDQIVSSVAYGVEGAVTRAMRNVNRSPQVFNLYLDQDHKIGTYTLEQLQDMAKSNGKPLTIG